jgi:hypothetical protein
MTTSGALTAICNPSLIAKPVKMPEIIGNALNFHARSQEQMQHPAMGCRMSHPLSKIGRDKRVAPFHLDGHIDNAVAVGVDLQLITVDPCLGTTSAGKRRAF